MLIAAIRKGREILAASAFRPYLGPERYPGAAAQSDGELEHFIRTMQAPRPGAGTQAP